MSQKTYTQDKDATLDYTMSWINWLGTDTIASATATGDSGITVSSVSHDDSTVTYWVSGGTVGKSYNIVVHIVTAAGRTDDRTVAVTVIDM